MWERFTDWLWAFGMGWDARSVAKRGPESRKTIGWYLAWFAYRHSKSY